MLEFSGLVMATGWLLAVAQDRCWNWTEALLNRSGFAGAVQYVVPARPTVSPDKLR